MQNSVFFLTTLITNVSCNALLVTKFADHFHKMTICPKIPTPKLFLLFWIPLKNLYGSDVLQYRDDLSCNQLRNRLNQNMNMVFVSANFKKMHCVSFLNFQISPSTVDQLSC